MKFIFILDSVFIGIFFFGKGYGVQGASGGGT